MLLASTSMAACGSGDGPRETTPPPTSPPQTSASTTTAPVTTGPSVTTAPTASATPSTPAATPVNLVEAIGAAPADASALYFRDWDMTKDALGVHGPSTALPDDDLQAFFRAVFQSDTPDLSEGQVDPASQLDRWGFTAIDLRWESFLPGSGTVLAFDDDFDVSSLVDAFVACGFEQQDVNGVPVFVTESSNECLTAPPALVATLPTGTAFGVDAAGGFLVIAMDPAAVATELAVLAGEADRLSDEPGSTEFLEQLAPANFAVLVAIDLRTCGFFANGSLPSDPSNLEELQAQQAPYIGHLYRWLVLAEQYEADHPTGQIGFLYGNADYAVADLPLRNSADAIPSLKQGKTYQEFAFTTTDVDASGTTIMVQVGPPPDGPLDLTRLYNGGGVDLMFALCGRVPRD
jgi:hypothetical protein